MTKVPLLDLTRTDPAESDELRAAFERVLQSGYFILGPEVEALERECAAQLGARHALGVSSGTDALLLALMALGIAAGDEVLCPTYTFFASAGTIARLGAKPVFVDVLPDSFNVDPADLERRITPRCRAMMPVHLYGQAADLEPLRSLARDRGLAIVEDSAQAIGARYGTAPVGTLGEFGCFSFFPTKNLGALGDAGLVTTEDDELAHRARILRVHGGHPKYHHHLVGGNFRIDALQAAFLRVKLPRLEAATAARIANAARYNAGFEARGVAVSLAAAAEAGPGHVVLPRVGPHGHTWNQYVIRVTGPQGSRDRLRQQLADDGVMTEIYYPIPLHLQPCFRELGHQPGDFPVAERAAAESLALPVFPQLRADEIDRVVERVGAWCAAERG